MYTEEERKKDIRHIKEIVERNPRVVDSLPLLYRIAVKEVLEELNLGRKGGGLSPPPQHIEEEIGKLTIDEVLEKVRVKPEILKHLPERHRMVIHALAREKGYVAISGRGHMTSPDEEASKSEDIKEAIRIAKEDPELIRSLPLLYQKVVEKLVELDRGKGGGHSPPSNQRIKNQRMRLLK